MEHKCKIRIALILFALTAISAMYFLLADYPSNRITINNDDADNNTTYDDRQNEKPEGTDTKKEDIKKIDWQTMLEKWKGEDVSIVKTDKKVIALTFDGGANADGVDKILGILKDNGIKGTFFLTGKFIEKYPNETEAIIASGGDIGNHSYSHPYFTKLTNEEISSELEKTENELSKLSATFKPFFRFPYGDRNVETISLVNNRGYIPIRWTIDSLGWKGTSGGMTKESIESRVLSKAVPGAIILMHLGTNPDDKTQLDSEALPGIVSALKSQGYEFETIFELLTAGK